MPANALPPEVLRSALLDPWVRKKRIVSRVPGWRVDADDLHRVLSSRLPGRRITAEDLDDALRALGARPIGPGRLARRWASARGRPLPWPARYWLSTTAWYQATATTRRRGRDRDRGRE